MHLLKAKASHMPTNYKQWAEVAQELLVASLGWWGRLQLRGRIHVPLRDHLGVTHSKGKSAGSLQSFIHQTTFAVIHFTGIYWVPTTR